MPFLGEVFSKEKTAHIFPASIAPRSRAFLYVRNPSAQDASHYRRSFARKRDNTCPAGAGAGGRAWNRRRWKNVCDKGREKGARTVRIDAHVDACAPVCVCNPDSLSLSRPNISTGHNHPQISSPYMLLILYSPPSRVLPAAAGAAPPPPSPLDATFSPVSKFSSSALFLISMQQPRTKEWLRVNSS